MDAFQKLMDLHGQARETEFGINNGKHLDESLKTGLDVISSIIHEIEGFNGIKYRESDSIESLLNSLRSYTKCNIDYLEKNTSVFHITSKLAALIVGKIINNLQKEGKDVSIKKQFCLCSQLESINELDSLIVVVCELISANKLNLNSFISSVLNMDIPTVVFGAFQRNNIVSICLFIQQNASKKNVLDHFIKDLISYFGKIHFTEGMNTEEQFCDVGICLLVTLLRVGLGDKISFPESDSLQHCSNAVNSFIEQVIIESTEQVLSEMEGAPSGKHFLQLKEQQWHLEETVIQKFLVLNLQFLARGSGVTAKEALCLQLRWLQSEVLPSISVYLRNLLAAMGQEAALAGILSLIQEDVSNWKSILMFTSVFLKLFPEAAASFKDLIDGFLSRSFSRQNQQHLAVAFLLARQVCFLSESSLQSVVFTSYGSWFGATFGSDAGCSLLSATNPATFSFLLNFLTELVPTEPPLCLRVHINKVPAAPPQCSHLLSDYVSLAKTRLQDLGETTGSGLFAFENTPQDDVEAALTYFEQSGGQISRVLLDSSRFRKTQYEQHFLPALLVPEVDGKVHSTRRLLISKLVAARKIPTSLFQDYELACQRLSSQYPSVLQKSGPSTGNPLDVWQVALEMLVDAVRNEGIDANGSLVNETEAAFASAATQLKTVLRWAAGRPDSRTLQNKVVVRLLKAYELIFVPPISPNILKSFSLPRCSIVLFSPFPYLLQQFRRGVYRLACNASWPRQAIQAAAALACAFDLEDEEPMDLNATVSSDTSIVDSSALGEAVGKALKPTSQQTMIHALTFCSFYFSLMDEGCNGVPPNHIKAPTLLGLFTYLQERLSYSDIEEVQSVCTKSWAPNLSWDPVVKQHQLNFKEWLELESNVQPKQDPVKERHLYLSDCVIRHWDKDWGSELLSSCLIHNKKGNEEWGNELLHCITHLAMSSALQDLHNKFPWLLASWMEIADKSSHQDVLKIVQHLPSWMLLTNKPFTPPSIAAIQALAKFINTDLKECLSERGFLIPEVLRLILRATLHVSTYSQEDILKLIIDECPPLYIGILRFGIQLKPLLSTYFKSKSASHISYLDNLVNAWSPTDSQQSYNNCKWEEGLVMWSQKMPLQKNGGLLYFHLLDLGMKLLLGEVKMVTVMKGPVLPSTTAIAFQLVQEPLHCLQLVRDAASTEPIGFPAKGLPKYAQAGLCLATIGVFLSLPEDQISTQHRESTQVCNQVIRHCLEKWKDVCLDLSPCDSQVRKVVFVRWLVKRCQLFVQQLTSDSVPKNVTNTGMKLS